MNPKPPDASTFSSDRDSGSRRYIDEQIALIAKLTPGSDEHRMATNMLLLLQDGLALLVETEQMLERVRTR